MQQLLILPGKSTAMTADIMIRVDEHMPLQRVVVWLPSAMTEDSISALLAQSRALHCKAVLFAEADAVCLPVACKLVQTSEDAHLVIVLNDGKENDLASAAVRLAELPADMVHTEVWLTHTAQHLPAYEILEQVCRQLNQHVDLRLCGFPVCRMPEGLWDRIPPQAELRARCTGVSAQGAPAVLPLPFAEYIPGCADCALSDACTAPCDPLAGQPRSRVFSGGSKTMYHVYQGSSDVSYHLGRYTAVSMDPTGLQLCSRLYGELIHLPLKGVSQRILLQMLNAGTTADTLRAFLQAHTGRIGLFERMLQGCVIE